MNASGVKIGSEDLDLQNVSAVPRLLGGSFELITVKTPFSPVRLVRSGLCEDFPSNNPSLLRSLHLTIAEICLTYLNSRCRT